MSQPIRWGILGAGRIAASFAEALGELPDARLAAVASRSATKADDFARRTGAGRAHHSYQALVEDPGVDVVYVATPNSLHRDHCLLALDAGKPVLCEKPLATDAASAREIAARAAARGLFCMEAMWMRFTPAARELKSLVEAGAIGTPQAVTASLGFRFADVVGNPVFDPALGGGALLDLGVYGASLAVWLLGQPTEAQGLAVLGRGGVEEQVAALLAFESGAQATVHASLRSQLSNDAVVVGSEGLLRVEAPLCCPEAFTLVRSREIRAGSGTSGLLRRAARLPLLRTARRMVAGLRQATTRRPVRGNGLSYEAAEVMRCLRASLRESPIMPLRDSIQVLEVLDRVRRTWHVATPRAN